MPRVSSAASGLPTRWKARSTTPPYTVQSSAPREEAAGVTLDLWAERATTPGEVADLEQVARLIGRVPLMTRPALCHGVVAVTGGILRASVTLVGIGGDQATRAAVAESNLADLWLAVHLALRPEAAHVRSATQLLTMARIQRAIG